MAGKMGVGTGETEQTILSRLNSDIQEQRVRVGQVYSYIKYINSITVLAMMAPFKMFSI